MEDKLRTVREMLNQDKAKKAEAFVSRLLRTEPSTTQVAQLLALRARAHLLNANPEQGLKDLQQLQNIAPDVFNQPQTQETLADCYLARFELSAIGFTDRTYLTKAQETYQALLENHPNYENSGWILYQYGRSWLASDNITRAVSSFQKALNNPSKSPTHKANCYERLGYIEFYHHRNFERALELLNLALAVYPNGADPTWLVQLHLQRARILQATNQPEAMIQVVSTAIKIAVEDLQQDRPFISDTLFTSAELVAAVPGFEQRAVALLERFVQISPRPVGINVTWSRAYEMMGDLYFELGRYDAATAAYSTALQFNPYHPWGVSVYYRMAKSQYQQGNYAEAVNIIQHMVNHAHAESEPVTDYRVYDILGNALFAQERYTEAAQAYQTAMSLAHDSAEGLDKIKLYYHFSRQLAQQ